MHNYIKEYSRVSGRVRLKASDCRSDGTAFPRWFESILAHYMNNQIHLRCPQCTEFKSQLSQIVCTKCFEDNKRRAKRNKLTYIDLLDADIVSTLLSSKLRFM